MSSQIEEVVVYADAVLVQYGGPLPGPSRWLSGSPGVG
jgi:hypothetical protein